MKILRIRCPDCKGYGEAVHACGCPKGVPCPEYDECGTCDGDGFIAIKPIKPSNLFFDGTTDKLINEDLDEF